MLFTINLRYEIRQDLLINLIHELLSFFVRLVVKWPNIEFDWFKLSIDTCLVIEWNVTFCPAEFTEYSSSDSVLNVEERPHAPGYVSFAEIDRTPPENSRHW